MLELAILGLLKERSMHGYQLKKHLADTLGGFWQVSYGSLYPALKRLQKEGAVEMIFPREQVGRRKNVYRITPVGEALFAELLERAGQDASADDGFSVRFAFFQYLKPETRIRLLERRRTYLESRWSMIKQSLQSYKERIDGYTLSLMNHQLSATESDIRWLDDLIAAEQTKAPATRRPRTRRASRPGATPSAAARLTAQRERA
jgi:DNA-binding PadR family transcriptional regulator